MANFCSVGRMKGTSVSERYPPGVVSEGESSSGLREGGRVDRGACQDLCFPAEGLSQLQDSTGRGSGTDSPNSLPQLSHWCLPRTSSKQKPEAGRPLDVHLLGPGSRGPRGEWRNVEEGVLKYGNIPVIQITRFVC